MHPGDPLRWTEPATWPIFVWGWLAFVLLGTLGPGWQRLRRARIALWPTTEGRIESAEVGYAAGSPFTIRGRLPYRAQIAYSYSVQGGLQGGTYQRHFATEEDALEFVRDLRGRPLEVHYDPNSPS